jgi:Flp pilus assembly protein TadD
MKQSTCYLYYEKHRRDVLLSIVLVCAILVAYFPAYNGGFIWDDDAHVTRPDLRSLHGLSRIWLELGATQQYYPLLHSAFWFEHRLWGDSTFAYHAINVLLHALVVCLLLQVLRRLKIPGAALAAAIFALHPVHAESVAWISEQKNTLSAVFYLSAMLAYLRFDEESDIWSYALASVFFVLALFTKTVTASLPAALLLIFWWKRGRLSLQRDVAPLLPWFAIGAAGGLLTAWVERMLIGAEGAPFELTLLQRGLLAGRIVWFYLYKLFWPVDLLFIYPRWMVNPGVWWQYLFPIGAIALIAVAWFMRRRSRAPLVALLFFIGSLFPVLGFFNVFPFIFSFVADHFQYLSSLGIIVVVSAAISVALARMPRLARQAGQALCILLLVVLGVSSWMRSKTYSDSQTLYLTTLDKNPDCWMCHNNLGILLSEAGQPVGAMEQFEATLRLKPDDAFAHNNLGKMLFQAGQLSAAIDHFEQAVQQNPKSALLRLNLGSVLLTAGRLPEAVDQFQQTVSLKPTLVEARYRLGNALMQMENLPAAKEQYESILRINPDYAQARAKLSELRAREHATQSTP